MASFRKFAPHTLERSNDSVNHQNVKPFISPTLLPLFAKRRTKPYPLLFCRDTVQDGKFLKLCPRSLSSTNLFLPLRSPPNPGSTPSATRPSRSCASSAWARPGPKTPRLSSVCILNFHTHRRTIYNACVKNHDSPRTLYPTPRAWTRTDTCPSQIRSIRKPWRFTPRMTLSTPRLRILPMSCQTMHQDSCC